MTGISTKDGSISGTTTASGKTFTTRNYICGMDPQKLAELIGWQHFPKRDQVKLKYEYSDNGVMVYLGLKPGFDPAKYGLGNHNTWHCMDWGMNTMWEAGIKLDVEHALFFMSTPTMHGNDSGNVAPDGGHIIELATFSPYAPFRQAAEQDHKKYLDLKKSIPGIYGTVTTGMELYMDLTGDYFYQQAAAPDEV